MTLSPGEVACLERDRCLAASVRTGRLDGVLRRPRRASPRPTGLADLSPGTTLGDVAPVAEDGGPVAHPQHLGEPVGDEQHRAAPVLSSPRITAKTCSAWSAGRAAVISSSISSCGSCASARARSSSRNSARGARGSASPGRGRSRSSGPATASPIVRRCPVRRRFSLDRQVGDQRRVLENGGQPGLLLGGARGPAVAPFTSIVRCRRRYTPERILTKVLFPAPLAPSRAWISAGLDR